MNKINRITSIDALRGIVLLGILIVHTVGLFEFESNYLSYNGSVDFFLQKSLNILLSGRCNIVFSILFGISFYLILKKPQYSSRKFAWRCILLFILGILIKFFYTYDALMWYGMMGIILIFFRNHKPYFLFISFVVTYLLSIILIKFSLGDLIFGEHRSRYFLGTTFCDIIHYPIINSIEDYLRAVFNGGIFKTLSYFILGYYFAKRGIVDNLRGINRKYLLYIGVLYIAFWGVSFIVTDVYYRTLFKTIGNLFGGLFYSLCFLFIYHYFVYKKNMAYLFKGLESYGKLGLTNYCMQNICGVIIMATVFIPYEFQFRYILFYSILFYLAQMVFSVIWLHYYKYGPFEWCWRCLTNMKIIINKR